MLLFPFHRVQRQEGAKYLTLMYNRNLRQIRVGSSTPKNQNFWSIWQYVHLNGDNKAEISSVHCSYFPKLHTKEYFMCFQAWNLDFHKNKHWKKFLLAHQLIKCISIKIIKKASRIENCLWISACQKSEAEDLPLMHYFFTKYTLHMQTKFESLDLTRICLNQQPQSLWERNDNSSKFAWLKTYSQMLWN